MQRLEVSGAVRPLYGSLGVKGLMYDAVAFCLKLRKGQSLIARREYAGSVAYRATWVGIRMT